MAKMQDCDPEEMPVAVKAPASWPEEGKRQPGHQELSGTRCDTQCAR